jgi:hypothetical protein
MTERGRQSHSYQSLVEPGVDAQAIPLWGHREMDQRGSWPSRASAPGPVRGVLRRVHARDKPALDGTPREPSAAERELERVQGNISRVLEAIKNGFAGPDLKAEWDALQERKTALQMKLESADEPPPLVHPGMAELFGHKITDLARALEHPDMRAEAAAAIRGLVDAIVLTPSQSAFRAVLRLAERPFSASSPSRQPASLPSPCATPPIRPRDTRHTSRQRRRTRTPSRMVLRRRARRAS